MPVLPLLYRSGFTGGTELCGIRYRIM